MTRYRSSMYSFYFYFSTSERLSFDFLSESSLLSSLYRLLWIAAFLSGVSTNNSLLSSFPLNFFVSVSGSFMFFSLFFGVVINSLFSSLFLCYSSIFVLDPVCSFSNNLILVFKGEPKLLALNSPLLFFITGGRTLPFTEDELS